MNSPRPGRPGDGSLLPAAQAVAGGSAAVVASPCINVCRMHEPTGWCEGCLRTLDEIAFWSVLDEEDKRAVRAALDQRRIEWSRLRAAVPPAGGPA